MIGFNENRQKHSFGVAQKMYELAKEKGWTEDKCRDMFLLGYLHDIGYQFSDTKDNHNSVGGLLAGNNGYKYWKEIMYHGDPFIEGSCSEELTLLNIADMSVDSKGNNVGVGNRLEDIRNRYGEYSIQYQNSLELAKKIFPDKDVTKNKKKEKLNTILLDDNMFCDIMFRKKSLIIQLCTVLDEEKHIIDHFQCDSFERTDDQHISFVDKYLTKIGTAKIPYQKGDFITAESLESDETVTLCVTGVKLKRIWYITDEELENEGFHYDGNNRKRFSEQWNKTFPVIIREKFGWNCNPWIWIVSFEL